jgi:heat shock protein HslJ
MKACLLLLPLALAACASAPESTPPAATASSASSGTTLSAATLERYQWQLHDAVDGDNKRLDALFGKPDKPLQLDFSADRVRVSNACNNISGSYQIVEGHLVAGPLMQTRMACTDPTLMQRETTITAVLQGKPTAILTTAGTAPLLTLAAESGQTLTFAGKPKAATP